MLALCPVRPERLNGSVLAQACANSSWLWQTLIPAGAGLVGVLAGGGITLRVESARRADEERRQEKADALIARASARLERDRLTRYRSMLNTSIESQVWPPQQWPRPDELPIEDMRVLAQHLTASEIARVNIARMFVSQLPVRCEIAWARTEQVFAPFQGNDAESFAEWLRATDEARAALDRLSADP